MIRSPDLLVVNHRLVPRSSSIAELSETYFWSCEYIDVRKWKDMRARFIGIRLATQYTVGRIAYELRKRTGTPTYALLKPIPGFKRSQADVLSIVIHALPIPDERTPWEQLMEFRYDIDSQRKFLDLRNWMNEISRAELSAVEIEQKLEYLLSQYERHMALHRMKIN